MGLTGSCASLATQYIISSDPYYKIHLLITLVVYVLSYIYYLKDDADNEIIGNNKASCMKMKLSFVDKKVDKVKFIGKPEALFTPTNRLTDEVKLLKGFSWQVALRPCSPADL